MKNIILFLLFVPTIAFADITPASVTHQNTAKSVLPIEERINREIKLAADDGYHVVAVDFDGYSWSDEKRCMKLLKQQGYKVDFANSRNVYGYVSLNGALKIEW